MSLPARNVEHQAAAPHEALAKLREIRNRLPPGEGAANARLELVTTRAGFDALEDQWNALFER